MKCKYLSMLPAILLTCGINFAQTNKIDSVAVEDFKPASTNLSISLHTACHNPAGRAGETVGSQAGSLGTSSPKVFPAVALQPLVSPRAVAPPS